MSRGALAVVLAVAVGALAVALWPEGPPAAPGAGVQATLAVRDVLGEGGAGFARALAPRALSFPEDHGPHPDFRTEWWYYTGNLRTATGRHFGFQLTFFRVALAPPAGADPRTPPPAGSRAATPTTAGARALASSTGAGPRTPPPASEPRALASWTGEEPRASAWATRQLFVAHFAVTDTRGKRFRATSRASREALGLAGAQARPFRVWVEDWSVEGEGPGALPMRLRAEHGDVALDLTLSAAKPVVLQGDRGLSRKGAEPGNASYYYSLTRMPASGVVRVGADSFDVAGLAWMDREWSTSALGPDLAGWDWFALQLDDAREVMFYLLRGRDGSTGPFSAGSLVAADGTVRRLGAEDVAIETLAHWTSPRSGVRYPARWRLTLPSEDLSVEIDPRLPDQELAVGTRYWEGAVAVEGTAAGRAVTGQGYVELVGYGESE